MPEHKGRRAFLDYDRLNNWYLVPVDEYRDWEAWRMDEKKSQIEPAPEGCIPFDAERSRVVFDLDTAEIETFEIVEAIDAGGEN